MLYKDFLKIKRGCPFCEPRVNEIIKKENYAFLTYALAPYHKHHLLVIPIRHVKLFEDLNKEELESINVLLHEGAKILKSLEYKDYTILVRNGSNASKSIEHLHYHIIPAVMIGDLDHKGEKRKIMTEDEINKFMEEINKII